MRIIVITPPQPDAVDFEAIDAMMKAGLFRLHLRFPAASEEQMRGVIERINPCFYDRISLNDHHLLASEYGIGGVHLNARCPVAPARWGGLVSRSCHALEQIASDVDYQFLSPIFNSISKLGYHATFTVDDLRAAAQRQIIDERVFALGGIAPDCFPLIKELNFGGVAMLGYVWNLAKEPNFIAHFEKMVRFL